MKSEFSYTSISGKENPLVKEMMRLHKDRQNLVFIEGTRLCRDALESGVKVVKVIFTEDKKELVSSWYELFLCLRSCSECYLLTDSLFRKITSTVNPQGVAMVVEEPDLYKGTDNLPKDGSGKDIYLVAEAVQDPGNLGTMIRTADAFAYSAVILLPGTCDPFSDKVLRASMGSCWHIPIIRMDDKDKLFKVFAKDSVNTYAMHLQGEELNDTKISLPCAYFIGNEGKGLSDDLSSKCDKLLKIVMPGKAESLNAAAAASIMGYVFSTKKRE